MKKWNISKYISKQSQFSRNISKYAFKLSKGYPLSGKNLLSSFWRVLLRLKGSKKVKLNTRPPTYLRFHRGLCAYKVNYCNFTLPLPEMQSCHKNSYSNKNCQINQNLKYFESNNCGKPLDAPTEMHWKCDGVTRKCEIHRFVVTSPSNHVLVEVIKRNKLEMR